MTDQVWGLPWRGNQIFARQAFCIGGKSVFWGGWAPRSKDDVFDGPLAQGIAWPKATADYLEAHYKRIELQMGVRENVVLEPSQAPAVRHRAGDTATLGTILATLFSNVDQSLPGFENFDTASDCGIATGMIRTANQPWFGLLDVIRRLTIRHLASLHAPTPEGTSRDAAQSSN